MNSISDFFSKNKVLIFGLILAAVLPVYDLIQNGTTTTADLIVAASAAAAAYLSRNLRGQWQTLAGIAGTVIASYATQKSGGHVQWWQLLMQGLILYLTASMPPAKSVAYEQTPTIMNAKQQGENAVPTLAPPPPSGK